MKRLNGSKWIRPKRRAQVYARDAGACVLCLSREDLTLDHIVPRLRGGGNESANLVTMCRSCNSRKGAHEHWADLFSHGQRQRYGAAVMRAALHNVACAMLSQR